MKCCHTHETGNMQRRYFLQRLAAGALTALLPGGNLLAAGFTLPSQGRTR